MVKRAGFTLVEVIVALLLLAIGVLGVAAAGLLATRMLRAADVHDEMSIRAMALLDSLIADSVVGQGSSRTPAYAIDWAATGDSAAVTFRAADSAVFTVRAIR